MTVTRFVLSLSIIGLCGCSAAPSTLSICEIVGRPYDFDKKLITTNTAIFSDGLERLALFDDNCPRASIAVQIPSDIAESKEARRIVSTFFESQDHGRDRRVEATISGTIVWRPNSIPRIVLIVRAISKLTIRHGQQRDLDKAL